MSWLAYVAGAVLGLVALDATLRLRVLERRNRNQRGN